MTTHKPTLIVSGPFATAEDPMSDAEYQAKLRALDTARAALTNEYITSQIYPRWAYHATEPAHLVYSDAEALALGPGWSPEPVSGRPPAAIVTALEPDTAALGSPDVVLHVIGTGFALDAVILWNGAPEPTTNVSSTELTTLIDMSTAEVAITLPVAVRQSGVDSNALDFTLTEAAATTTKKARTR